MGFLRMTQQTLPSTLEPSTVEPSICGIELVTVLENASDAIVCLDREWRYTYVNHAAELLLRRKRDDLLGKVHWEEYPALVGTPAETQLRAAFNTQRPCNFEQFLPGLYAWHSVLAVPSADSLLLFSRDITERIRALRDEAVRAGLRNILEHVPVAITITRGPEHRIELQNARSRALLDGRNVEGYTLINALPEAEPQGFVALLDKVYASGEAFIGHDMLLSYDCDNSGTLYQDYYDLTYQPIFETDGKVSGILHLGVEVTERLREKNMLARFAAERDATLRQLSEGVILTDATGRITFVNEMARVLHGVAVLDVEVDQYTATYQLLTVDGQPYPSADLPLARAALRGESVINARWRICRPDASVVLVEGSAQPVRDEQGKTIACVLTLRLVIDE